MIAGENISLSLFTSEAEIEEFWNLYSDMRNRSEFDHTELTSLVTTMKNFRETGLWTDSKGTMIIKDRKDSIIGVVSFRSKSLFNLYAGYRIFESKNRGHGYGTEALKLFTGYLFDAKAIERITLEISTENIPSRRIAEKCGYIHEGTLRNAYYYFRSKLTDMAVYGILRSDWKNKTPDIVEN